MSEDTTTTTEQETVQAPEKEQPETPETQAVQAEDTQEGTQEQESADTTNQTEGSEEDELKAWAEKKGIKTNDPNTLLKMVKESEQKMHAVTQQAKKLRTSVETVGEEAGLSDLDQRLTRLTVREFYLDNPEAKQLDEQMAEIVTAKPYLAGDLETLYELAKARSNPTSTVEAKQQGQKEALAKVAKAEQAGPPQASATTRQGVKEITEAEIGDMSAEEYLAFKKETGYNPFKA